MGKWCADRVAGMAKGGPSNQRPLVPFDLAGPKNHRRGFYDWDKNNFAPRFSAAWTPEPKGGPFHFLTGDGKMVLRGGYARVFDRLGQGLAANFDNGFAFWMSTSISSAFGLPYESNPAARFRDLTTMPPTIPAAPAGGFPQTPPPQAGVITTSIHDTINTPSPHTPDLSLHLHPGHRLPTGAAHR